MIRTVVIPETKNVSISIPDHYIGKEVEIIAFSKDEGISKDDRSKKPNFTVLHTDLTDFKFNREEANKR